MLQGYIVNQLLNQHRLAHAGAAEQANFTPSGVGLQKVNDLDACLQNFYRGALFLKGGGAAVDGLEGGALGQGTAAVNGLTQHVEHAAQGGLPHGHLNGVAGDVYRQPAGQPLAGGEHDAAHRAPAHVLGHLHHPQSAVKLYGELLPQLGQLALCDLYVHYRAGDLYNNSSFHVATSFFDAGPWHRRRPR